jgi:hypothetical protein
MPAAYEKVRDKLISEGKSPQAAKSESAAIFNSRANKNHTPYLSAYVKAEKGPLSQFKHR